MSGVGGTIYPEGVVQRRRWQGLPSDRLAARNHRHTCQIFFLAYWYSKPLFVRTQDNLSGICLTRWINTYLHKFAPNWKSARLIHFFSQSVYFCCFYMNMQEGNIISVLTHYEQNLNNDIGVYRWFHLFRVVLIWLSLGAGKSRIIRN